MTYPHIVFDHLGWHGIKALVGWRQRFTPIDSGNIGEFVDTF